MPRIARTHSCPGGTVQHVLNRGNSRRRLFHAPGDYGAFLRLPAEAKARVPGVRLLGFCPPFSAPRILG